MTTIRLILKEIRFRALNFALSLLAVVAAVALFVGFFTTGEAANRETTRLMRDIGFNLRIIPRETEMAQFWDQGYSEHLMPEAYIERFATKENIFYTHLLATLQKKTEWRGCEILLTGLASQEVFAPGKKKGPMPGTFQIEPGTLYAGYRVAEALKLKEGETVDLLGKEMRVAKCLAEMGSEDDIRVSVHLSDAQGILNAEGKINEIKALECLCYDSNVDSLELLRGQIRDLLPEAEVVLLRGIAEARTRQRLMAEKHFAFVLPVLAIVCGAWIGVLAMINVRERQSEIGILRALGYGSGSIAALFLGRAILIGLIGAALGYAVGTALALRFGPEIFSVTAKSIEPIAELLVFALIAAPVFSAISSFIPAMAAVAHDPARTLRAE